jgi:hypothetical protein
MHDLTTVHIRAQMPYAGRHTNGRPAPNKWDLYADTTQPGRSRHVGELWLHGRVGDPTARYSTYLFGRGATLNSHRTVADALAEAGYVQPVPVH